MANKVIDYPIKFIMPRVDGVMHGLRTCGTSVGIEVTITHEATARALYFELHKIFGGEENVLLKEIDQTIRSLKDYESSMAFKDLRERINKIAYTKTVNR